MLETGKIFIADDHGLIRKGLRQVIESSTTFEVIEAVNGEEAFAYILKEKPSIAILDIEMPIMTGFEVAQKVQSQAIAVDLIFLTMFKDESIFNKAMDIGVKGYVLKENTVSEIIQCIHSVLKGKYYLSPAISDFLIRREVKSSTQANNGNVINALTPAEKNLLKHLGMMKTNHELAEEFNISIKTVQNHRTNICNKLGLKGAHALLKFAIEQSHLL
jgi:DNA-binding NarL/FixJ family response regulator